MLVESDLINNHLSHLKFCENSVIYHNVSRPLIGPFVGMFKENVLTGNKENVLTGKYLF